MRVAIQRLKAGAGVGQSDTLAFFSVRTKAFTIVLNFESECVALPLSAQLDLARARMRLDPMANRIFDQRLHDQIRDLGFKSLRRNLNLDLQPGAETDLLDLQVTLEEIQLALQRHFLRIAA